MASDLGYDPEQLKKYYEHINYLNESNKICNDVNKNCETIEEDDLDDLFKKFITNSDLKDILFKQIMDISILQLNHESYRIIITNIIKNFDGKYLQDAITHIINWEYEYELIDTLYTINDTELFMKVVIHGLLNNFSKYFYNIEKF